MSIRPLILPEPRWESKASLAPMDLAGRRIDVGKRDGAVAAIGGAARIGELRIGIAHQIDAVLRHHGDFAVRLRGRAHADELGKILHRLIRWSSRPEAVSPAALAVLICWLRS